MGYVGEVVSWGVKNRGNEVVCGCVCDAGVTWNWGWSHGSEQGVKPLVSAVILSLVLGCAGSMRACVHGQFHALDLIPSSTILT